MREDILDRRTYSRSEIDGKIAAASLNVADPRFGAVGDADEYHDVAITSGQVTLTRAVGGFAATAPGKTIILRSGGSGGADFLTRVLARSPDGTSVTLAAPASSSLLGGWAVIGTDNTAAFNAARAAGRSLTIPAGGYIYDGSGWEASGLVLRGPGPNAGLIYLGPGRSLIVATGGVASLGLEAVGVIGGYGAIRFTGGAASVQGALRVEGCLFDQYTGAAISSTYIDQPYWDIGGNTFSAKTDIGTLGISLSGDNAKSTIEKNAFLKNGIHVKLAGTAGQASVVKNNDFLRFGEYTTDARIDIWLSVQQSGAGRGCAIDENKFGSEGINAADFRILIADEDPASNTDQALRRPDLASPSTVTFRSAIFTKNTWAGAASNAPAFLASTTGDLRSNYIGDHIVSGTAGDYLVKYLFNPGDSRQTSTNTAGGLLGDITVNGDWSAFRICNYPGLWILSDGSGALEIPDTPLAAPGAGDPVSYALLVGSPVTSWSNVGTATRSPAVDAHGGSDAATVTIEAAGDVIYAGIDNSSVQPGLPIYVEFDAATGGASPATGIAVSMSVSGSPRWNRNIAIAPGWHRYRFIMTPRSASQINQLVIGMVAPLTGTFKIGRIRAYHSREPINVDGVMPNLAVMGSAVLGGAGASVGFFGASGTVRPAITGDGAGNAALASLLSALAGLGLIADSTT